ncbi:hypothetical protein [Glycomyces sp. NPDC021274]|uniref:hypothetical protein n=1 Tax=Glycomyces sp. NPDC021274 TaxID=3155120 RepID=UPI0033E0E9DE
MNHPERSAASAPRPEVRIVHLDLAAFAALAAGDLAAANRASPVPVSAYFAGQDWQWDEEDGLEIVYEIAADRLPLVLSGPEGLS